MRNSDYLELYNHINNNWYIYDAIKTSILKNKIKKILNIYLDIKWVKTKKAVVIKVMDRKSPITNKEVLEHFMDKFVVVLDKFWTHEPIPPKKLFVKKYLY